MNLIFRIKEGFNRAIRKLFVISAILLACPSHDIAAQSASINFERITAEDGLSQSQINCIIQDQMGFLWFGTNGGLNRFNGLEFDIYRHDAADSLSISNNIITHLFEDPSGDVLIATQNGLNLFDRGVEKFNFLDLLPENSSPSFNQHVTAIARDNEGYYWAGLSGVGLVKFRFEQKRAYILSQLVQGPEKLSSNMITCLSVDRNGLLWVGFADMGINVIEPETQQVIKRYEKQTGYGSISDNQINDIYEDRDGDKWIGTANGLTLIQYLPDQERITRFFNYSNPGHASSVSVRSIFQGASGLIWFGTSNRGLGKLNKKNGIIDFYHSDPNDQYALLSNNVISVFDDRGGILWIGTNAGINMIDRHSDRFHLYQREAGAENTMSSSNIQAIVKESNGIIWLGTHDQGLNKYDPLTRTYTTYLNNDILEGGESLTKRANILRKFNKQLSDATKAKLTYLSHNRVLTLHLDPFRPYLWIGTGGGGLNRLNLYSGKINTYPSNPRYANSLSGTIVRCLYTDQHRGLWIGTEDGGLNRYDGTSFRHYQHDPEDDNSLSSNNIQCITGSDDGSLWIGTFDGGLNRFDPGTNTIKRFLHSEEHINSISSNTVFCLLFADSSHLWIGTDDGLNLLNTEDESFTVYTIENELASNSIYAMQIDGAGNLWVSSNKGISKFDPLSLQCRNYDDQDGLQGSEFNHNSCYTTNQGEMLFGGIAGYNTFYPEQIKDNEYKPEIVITDFSILNEKMLPSAANSPLTKHISRTDTIILSHKRNTFSFEFVALNYTDSEKNEYRYLLENFDDQWVYAGTRRYANYTNVPPGKYRFRVIGSNNDGVWNYEGRSIMLIINPPFWNTWYFISLMVLLGLVLVYMLIYIRTRRLQRMKSVLERLVTSRTHQLENEKSRVEAANSEITNQKEEIEKQHNLLIKRNREITLAKTELDILNKELRSINAHLEDIVTERTSDLRKLNKKLIGANNELDRFIYRASHDLKGPIARLLGLTMIAKMDKNEHELDGYIDLIQKNAVEMNRAINKLNSVHQINKRAIRAVKVDFSALIVDVKQRLAKYIDLQPVSIKVVIAKDLELHSDAILLIVILENLIENALMFKRLDVVNVKISLRHLDHGYYLEVEDDGLGIPSDQHYRIFDMFFRGSEKSIGSGLGLYLVKKAVEKLHGRIELSSVENQYTRFGISIPVSQLENSIQE